MLSLLKNLFRTESASLQAKPAAKRQLSMEQLDDRLVPTVTFHGGNVLSNVEVEALYYGSNWSSNSTLFNQTGQFEGFLKYIANSPYMDMLNKAGYNVGRGSWDGGKILLTSPGTTLNDSDIRKGIQGAIKSGNPLATPDANRLYIVYVQPNVKVVNDSYYDSKNGRYDNSVQDFAGYHGAFAGTDKAGNAKDIRYAVITTPGGTVGNAKNNNSLNNFDEMTEATTHELAEAVTDPDINYKTKGWYQDDNPATKNINEGAEIGDLANGQVVYLNGYAVQKEVDKYGNVIVPTDLKFQSQTIRTTGFSNTYTLGIGTDSTGLTNVKNLTAYVGWGDGTYGYGTVSQNSSGQFVITGTHSYAKNGSYSVTVYLYDSTNVINTTFLNDTINYSSLISYHGVNLLGG